MSQINIKKATCDDLPVLASLFDGYRQFYDQESNLALAENFLKARIENKESVIFLATDTEGKGMGFTQLYPTFSSVSAQRSWILNDLFVASTARKQGVGEALMNRAKAMAKETGAKGILLETGKENTTAQKLYERLGYHQENDVFFYFLKT
ncbi:GNAT family N-acetyltransferase [Marinicella rhabdoformis]|uniref:GNAT family N-acetyltransferase n=1 Tax=Marinicella rhabdoformis TaxID=2580566 RepID=UPI0012AEBBD4|nr:GNAT family N-acetyltransferase [Marinicella rhabdoformis]